ncbi:MAG: thymidine phosphorylase [Endomicrobium sp.]|jgi:pyrimidine-nucleoside phosphorylase|nr:thymidine phosphorylase [Endomicrobium sp.]
MRIKIMRPYDVICKKRNNCKLSKEEIEFMVFSYNNGDIPDYQMSAFLMSIFFTGMTDEEIFFLTDAMVNSGNITDLSKLNFMSADKHSTGGVGDGTSIIIVPIVSSTGICVPMMAGRGLGHTGGTLDKLESIPGFRTQSDKKEFLGFLEYSGAAIIGQTSDIAPVDKKMYALRDATAAVESIPLISASIMSKKIAEGVKTLVLDVKTGDGAFIKEYSKSKELAQKMIIIGKKFGMNMSAAITDMDTPLGNCAGNSLEINQAVEILKGNLRNDLYELSIYLCALMIYSAKKSSSLEHAKDIAKKQIDNGKALEKFRQIIKMQGGNPKVIDNPDSVLPKAKNSIKIRAKKAGFISNMKTRSMGIAEMLTGSGREKKEDSIDYSAGILFYKKTNDYAEKNEVIAELVYNSLKNIEEAELIMNDAYMISEKKNENRKLIKEIL